MTLHKERLSREWIATRQAQQGLGPHRSRYFGEADTPAHSIGTLEAMILRSRCYLELNLDSTGGAPASRRGLARRIDPSTSNTEQTNIPRVNCLYRAALIKQIQVQETHRWCRTITTPSPAHDTQPPTTTPPIAATPQGGLIHVVDTPPRPTRR